MPPEPRTAFLRYGATSEATAAEVRRARQTHQEAQAAVRPARLTLDRAVAARVGAGELATAFDAGALIAAAEADETTATAASLGATHFP